MGLIYNLLYKGEKLQTASSTQNRHLKQLTPESIKFLVSIGLKPKIEYGHVRYYGRSSI